MTAVSPRQHDATPEPVDGRPEFGLSEASHKTEYRTFSCIGLYTASGRERAFDFLDNGHSRPTSMTG
jgi:hypothetical protein